jgi:uncharacterized protein YciI
VSTTWQYFGQPSDIFLVTSRSIEGAGDRGPHHASHLAWLEEGHSEGTILLSGPSADRTLGIYVVRAGSLEQASDYVASDPYHALGLRSFDIVQWEAQRRSMAPGLEETANS